jgi:hypothetical protein
MPKGLFFNGVPQRDIMLTKVVYRIQLKNRKNYRLEREVVFSVKRIGNLKLLMLHGVLGSLFK